MDKKGKQQAISALNAKFKDSKCAVLADYRGLKVSEVTELRSALKKASAELKVAKNTLAKIAAKGTHAEAISGMLEGPKAVIFTYGDPVASSKVLKDFAKKLPNFVLKGGILEGKILSLKEIEALADLPSKEVLLSRLLGALKSPQSGLVQVLSGVPRKLVYALDAIKNTKN